MKYYFGAVCVIFGVWLVVRGLLHRRAVLSARTGASAETGEREMSRQAMRLDAMRIGLAPIYVLIIVLAGVVLTGLWFIVDKGRVFSFLDIGGFLLAILAYAYWMYLRLRYSRLSLNQAD
jgi:hypothetical protein